MTGKNKGIKVVRVVRKAGHHQVHHGGSWKVAYADFVTAMMAFFLVMWIVGMETNVKDLIQGYFNNPIGFKRAHSTGLSPVSHEGPALSPGSARLVLLSRDGERRRLEYVMERIQRRLEVAGFPGRLEGRVELVLTREGLRIELIEAGEDETFFALGSAALTPAAQRALELIAPEIALVPNDIVIEGHTDARRYGSAAYTNWELSVDRANAARRALELAGIDGKRVAEVRGYADRQLRVPGRPLDPSNRRVSILLRYEGASAEAAAARVHTD
jgi:chemotaxis protein MotB